MALYEQAARSGNASAMHNLAVLYASGAQGTPDYKAAMEWFEKAAQLGVADSQFNLAILYARGNGSRRTWKNPTNGSRSPRRVATRMPRRSVTKSPMP